MIGYGERKKSQDVLLIIEGLVPTPLPSLIGFFYFQSQKKVPSFSNIFSSQEDCKLVKTQEDY